MTILAVQDLEVSYGGVRALRGASLSVEEGEIVALIGANGAGKTTLLRAISRLIPAKAGTIHYEGAALGGVAAHELPRRGLAHVPEGRLVFGDLTVQENLDLAGWWHKDAAARQADLDRVFTLFPRLAERRAQHGSTLSGGEQQMLAIARAIMARPKLILLDEPSMGLAPLLVRSIFATIGEINRMGTSILLVEQNANMALAIAHRAYVLQTGAVVLTGTAEELRRNPEIQEAYLG